MDLVDGSYCKISMQHLLEPDWAAVSALANRVTVEGRTLPYTTVLAPALLRH